MASGASECDAGESEGGKARTQREERMEERNHDRLKFTFTKRGEKSVKVTASSLASGFKGVLHLVTCFIFDK